MEACAATRADLTWARMDSTSRRAAVPREDLCAAGLLSRRREGERDEDASAERGRN
jgi:hypothetical protein